MTHTDHYPRLPRQSRAAKLARALLAAAATLSLAAGAIAGAAAPSNRVYPIGHLLPVAADRAVRGSTFAALRAQGYEILPPTHIAQL